MLPETLVQKFQIGDEVVDINPSASLWVGNVAAVVPIRLAQKLGWSRDEQWQHECGLAYLIYLNEPVPICSKQAYDGDEEIPKTNLLFVLERNLRLFNLETTDV